VLDAWPLPEQPIAASAAPRWLGQLAVDNQQASQVLLSGMGTFIALLRAINVGGTGKLAMAELAKLCEKAGFTAVTTYIQSGNVVFDSRASEPKVKALLEQALAAKVGKPVGVLLRSAAELEAVLAQNPFKQQPPSRVIVMFLDQAPPKSVLADVVAPGGEELAIHGREIYAHYPAGQGPSKLKLPLANVGTGRNINTVTKLAELARRKR
jgi:uncharacterized protein (DUF1697 family)